MIVNTLQKAVEKPNVCVSRSLKRSEGESAARRVSPLPAEENWTAYTEAVSV
jgi:hypothetical protein